ncbi:hypothetical protein EVAR_46189_1 [Eumeta japonica]|uniref:Uncharacterized protein n=1 Tax=Eumeta variegata TaxID=151549 RepID=A0A4C1WDJ9_EUMVA|nr:hypothetical protein EVAR_46189_1 [Eumeta japonica]
MCFATKICGNRPVSYFRKGRNGASPTLAADSALSPSDVLSLLERPASGNALVTPLEMRMFVDGGDHLLFGGSYARLPLKNRAIAAKSSFGTAKAELVLARATSVLGKVILVHAPRTSDPGLIVQLFANRVLCEAQPFAAMSHHKMFNAGDKNVYRWYRQVKRGNGENVIQIALNVLEQKKIRGRPSLSWWSKIETDLKQAQLHPELSALAFGLA